MTPKHPFSTVTPKTLEAIEDAVENGVEGAIKKASMSATPTHGTPSPAHGWVTAEQVYEIAERVHQRSEAERHRRCVTDGPAKELFDLHEDHEGRIQTMERAREREEGGRQLRTRLFAGLGVLGVLSGIASGWYGATHKAQAATSDVAAELQALRAELRRHPQPPQGPTP